MIKEIVIGLAVMSCIYMVQSASIENLAAAPEEAGQIENFENNIEETQDLETAETAGRGGYYRGGYGGYGRGYGGYGGYGRGYGGYGGHHHRHHGCYRCGKK